MGLFSKPKPLNPGDIQYSEPQQQFMEDLHNRGMQDPSEVGAQTQAAIQESKQMLEPESQQRDRLSALGMNVPDAMSKAIRQRVQRGSETELRNIQRRQDIENRLMSSGRTGVATKGAAMKRQNDIANYNRQMQDYVNAMQQRAQAISSILGVGGQLAGMALAGPAGAKAMAPQQQAYQPMPQSTGGQTMSPKDLG